MSQTNQTQVSRLKTRQRGKWQGNTEAAAQIEWHEEVKSVKDHFVRNLSVAAALVICAVTLRSGALPTLNAATDAVLTAATDQSLLDEQLGKLSFVSTLFPEAVLVFGEQTVEACMPVVAEAVSHAWTIAEPYTCWTTAAGQVVTAVTGEVTGIYHGYGDELIVEVTDVADYTWLYGNIATLQVALGDQVRLGEVIGTVMEGTEFALEVRRDGQSLDPQLLLSR